MFFQSLQPIIKFLDLKFSITSADEAGEKLKVTIFFNLKSDGEEFNLSPIVVIATPEELDNELVEAIQQKLSVIPSMAERVNSLLESMKKVEKEATSKASGKKTTSTRKKTTTASSKGKTANKTTSTKEEETKTEEQTPDLFKAAEETPKEEVKKEEPKTEPKPQEETPKEEPVKEEVKDDILDLGADDGDILDLGTETKEEPSKSDDLSLDLDDDDEELPI